MSSQGNFIEAEKCFKDALELFESQPAELQNFTLKAYCLNNLALLYMNNERLADAETYFKQVLQIAEKTDLTKDPILGIALDNLGQTYRFQKRFDDAEKTYKQALAAEEASIGKGTNDYAITQVNLAVLYITEKKHADAKKLLIEAMNTFETTAGKTARHIKWLTSICRLPKKLIQTSYSTMASSTYLPVPTTEAYGTS